MPTAMKANVAAPRDPAAGYSADELAAVFAGLPDAQGSPAERHLRRSASELVRLARGGELPIAVPAEQLLDSGRRIEAAHAEIARLRAELSVARQFGLPAVDA